MTNKNRDAEKQSKKAPFASVWSELISEEEKSQVSTLLSFYRWWDSLRRDREMPFLRDFLPAKLGYAADWAYALQRDRDGHLKVTHMGVALDALFSQELMEGNYLERLREEDAAILEEHVDQVLSLRCGGYLERRILGLEGRILQLRTLELPLAGPDGSVKTLCGMVVLMEEGPGTESDATASRYANFQYFDLTKGPDLDAWID